VANEKREYSWQIGSHPRNPGLIGILASRMAIATAEHAMKNQLTLGMVAGFLWIWASVSAPTFAAEPCGLWSEVPREGSDLIRFRKLKEFDGHAFLDMETCLIWQLDLLIDVQTLDSAAQFCAVKGQGGPNGRHMGWRLPTQAELTSLDSEEWLKQRDAFETDKLPPIVRSEVFFWTLTPWPSEPDSLAGVMFSALTTVVAPIKRDVKARAWCTRGSPATGLR